MSSLFTVLFHHSEEGLSVRKFNVLCVCLFFLLFYFDIFFCVECFFFCSFTETTHNSTAARGRKDNTTTAQKHNDVSLHGQKRKSYIYFYSLVGCTITISWRDGSRSTQRKSLTICLIPAWIFLPRLLFEPLLLLLHNRVIEMFHPFTYHAKPCFESLC
jgi:hypothetical protein